MSGGWTSVYDGHPDSPRRMFITKNGLRYTQEQYALLQFMKRLEKKLDKLNELLAVDRPRLLPPRKRKPFEIKDDDIHAPVGGSGQ